MTSAEAISKMFEDESQKLKNFLDVADSKTHMNIHEIVETYYQVMNVLSMATMLKQQADSEPEDLFDKIGQIEKLISERFNSSIHPKIMDTLSSSIQKLTKTLQSESTGEKSKEQIEKDAKLFDELRQTMSTKEFVEQYDSGLAHD